MAASQLARSNEDGGEVGSSFPDMRSLIIASPILTQSGPSVLPSTEADSTSPSTITMPNTAETDGSNLLLTALPGRCLAF
ncbi:hypothetical protein N7508_005972 [Penicillium antarcticum]|uniref:uncharacterized protein n=1 Tax=Penicillium antarcticum TaxID=416450 RepID=UPI00239302BB|nr:uncharacterized protein N7508_005972 [Penicillium antarcticum]KAJ5306957.1 hypothetical protein N7508_005972 [Penicillium antarcticum]